MTILPPIDNSGQYGKSQLKHNIPTPYTSSILIRIGKHQIHHKRDRETIKILTKLRAVNEYLTPSDTLHYRNTPFEDICKDALSKGYHETFTEMYCLVEKNKELRIKAGRESLLWLRPELKNEVNHLKTLYQHLSNAEKAKRNGKASIVHSEETFLANYFKKNWEKDGWLSTHFFQKALDTALLSRDEELKSISYLDFGLICEKNDENEQSLMSLENLYELCCESNQTVKKNACIHLARLYNKVANSYEKNPTLYIQLLDEAYKKADESEDELLVGLTANNLGMGYIKCLQPKEALIYFQMYLTICETGDDELGINKACRNISKSQQFIGNVDLSISYLERAVSLAKKVKNHELIAETCLELGCVFNLNGNYMEALNCFDVALSASKKLDYSKRHLLNSSKILKGIASAHTKLPYYNQHLSNNSPFNHNIIQAWKSLRINELDDLDFPRYDCSAEHLFKEVENIYVERKNLQLQKDIMEENEKKKCKIDTKIWQYPINKEYWNACSLYELNIAQEIEVDKFE